jgi:NAD(P)-dependent dehydrogenase (short-subunit alcohol dehydrogenase family)
MPVIDVLILNAGLYKLKLHALGNGFEAMMGIMHFGHFRLTRQLLEAVQAAKQGRIIVTSSVMHQYGKINEASFRDPSKHRIGLLAYGQAKLANLLFARELARRVDEAGVDALSTAAHPGSTRTELQRHSGLMHAAVRVFAQEAPAGALPILYAATANDVRGADYFGPRHWLGAIGPPGRASSSPHSNSQAVARRLWEVSKQLTGVAYAL